MAWRRHARAGSEFQADHLQVAMAAVADAYEAQSQRPGLYTADLSDDPGAVAEALRLYAERLPE